MKVQLLDDKKGFVELVDFMGSDLTVVNSARVSYGKQKTALSDDDIKLINYLMKHKHWTPFEHCTVTFRMKTPLFVARQIFRHRTFSYNEISRRYTSADLDFYIPSTLRLQSTKDKQSSTGSTEMVQSIPVRDIFIKDVVEPAVRNYHFLIKNGIAREMARMVLPQNMYTTFYMSGNLRNWFHFLGLRLDEHSQKETREYAKAIYRELAVLFPNSVYAWERFGKEM